MKQPDYRMPLAVAICCITLMALIFVRAHAQTGSGSQWSTAFTSGPLSTCPTPAAGSIIQCAVTNIGVEQSVNGSAYVPVNQLPVQGAKGDTGPVGPMGPAGPQGPAGTSATAPVTSVNGKTGAVVISLHGNILTNQPPFTLGDSSGILSGTPSSVGTTKFTVQVKDSLGHIAQKALSLTVAAPIP